ncbi:alpha/beta fold hydrolase [Thalassococcus sp. S3]|uniref:alpha/beta fold hydrolase n=1 Tax=Thalassococcus sp. S3 TaxID=2017482 RepID=UPI001023F74C|nr:alpha/beta hydrolase [Thalassococcus sp. S3]QBF31277.1 hypothetical protein CFI11_08610 [Thalassococcus sp. S3]
MLRVVLTLVCAVVLAACAGDHRQSYALPLNPMLFEPEKIAQADTLVIGIPGALSSVGVLAPLQQWRSDRLSVAFYRLPGMDGRGRSESLSLRRAAETISIFVQSTGIKRVYFVGFSTGSAIAMESAKRLRRADPEMEIKIAGVSSAVPLPQPYIAGLKGAGDLLSAASRTGSLSRSVYWPEYFRTLLYGPRTERDAIEAASAEVLLEERQQRVTMPDVDLARSHGLALLGWTNANKADLAEVPIFLFHGEHDPVFSARAIRRFSDRLPQAEALVFKDQGHLLLLTVPGLFDLMRAKLGID